MPAGISEVEPASVAGLSADELDEASSGDGVEGDEPHIAEVREFVLAPGHHGQRIDKVLADLVPEFSRSYLQQLLALGAVQYHGVSATKASAKVRAGEVVRLEMRPTLQSQAFRPESLPLDVVYEDEHLLIINKAAGMVVHPAPGNWSGTLLNALLARHSGASLVPRAGIVHRLDKDTSGLMVVARTRSTMDALVGMIARREVSRQYLALAERPWRGALERTVQAPIGRDPRNRLRMAVVDLASHAGKPARTDFRCLATASQGCLVHCTLHTGRTHQIRVHMASLGHPLVADVLYGGQPVPALDRQGLHAYRLAFDHPVTHQPLLFQMDLPGDMSRALLDWGLGYNPAP